MNRKIFSFVYVLVLLAMLAMALPAQASQPNTVEVQIASSAVIASAAKTAVTGAQSICPQPFPCPGGNCIIDHIGFPQPPTLRRASLPVQVSDSITVPGGRPQVVIPVSIFIKQESCVLNPGCAPDTYVSTPTANVIADLAVSGTKLCMTLVGTEPAIPQAQGLIDKLNASMSANQKCPIDLGAVADFLGPDHLITGRGVSVNGNFDRIAVRFEFDSPGPGSFPAWKSFLMDGTLGPTVPGKAFSLFIDKGLILGKIAGQMKDGLQAEPKIQSFKPISGIWQPYGLPFAFAQMHVDAELRVGACPNTISVWLRNEPFFTLKADGSAIETNAHLDWGSNAWDVFACASLYGGPAFAAMVSPALAALAASFKPNLALPDNCSQVNEKHFKCTTPLNLPPQVSADEMPINLQDQGILIGGSIFSPSPAPQQPLSFFTEPPYYGVKGSCGSGFGLEYLPGMIAASGNGKLCARELHDDPLNVFSLSGNLPSPLPVSTGINFQENPAYWQSPYPIHVTFRTSVGSRTVEVPAVTQEHLTLMEKEMLMMQVMLDCILGNIVYDIPLWNPHWLVDPPENNVPVELQAQDRSIVNGTASLANVSVEFLAARGMPLPSTRETTRFDGEAVRLTADVIVNAGRFGRFVVPISTSLRADFAGRADGHAGIAALALVSDVSSQFTVPRGSLPSGIAAATVRLRIPAGRLGIFQTRSGHARLMWAR